MVGDKLAGVSVETPRHAAAQAEEDAVLPKHAVAMRSHKFARGTALVVTALVVFVATGVAAIYHHLNSAITVLDVSDLITQDHVRPPAPAVTEDDRPITLLLMGTDYRGEYGSINSEMFGHDAGMGADTTLVVHIPSNRQWAEIFSIPRDALVDIPACPRSDGSVAPAVTGAMFNSAFSRGAGDNYDWEGAASCTLMTVENLTGIHITDFMIINMAGVVDVVNSLGGVEIDLPEPVVGNSNVVLDLPAGPQRLDGWQAINFLRARGGRGMGLELGSDLMRIERQQFFLEAFAQDVLSRNLVGDAAQLYPAIVDVMRSVSTNPELGSPMAMVSLVLSMRSFETDHLIFTEIPVVTAPNDPNRVVFTSQAADIWARIASGAPPQEYVDAAAQEAGPLLEVTAGQAGNDG